MSDRSVSPFTVNPNLNPATAAPPAPAHVVHNFSIVPQIDDTDPENEYLNNQRSLFAPPIDMSNPFAQQSRRQLVPFTVTSVLPRTNYKEEWEPKERRSDAYLAIQSELCYLQPAGVLGFVLHQTGPFRRLKLDKIIILPFSAHVQPTWRNSTP